MTSYQTTETSKLKTQCDARHTLNNTYAIAEINQKNTLKVIQLNQQKKTNLTRMSAVLTL
jgi:hypothetical protein